jgi:uncharacterized protein YoxC
MIYLVIGIAVNIVILYIIVNAMTKKINEIINEVNRLSKFKNH